MARSEVRSYACLATAFFLLQIGFWWPTHKMTPDMGIVPDVSTKRALSVMSFGDEEFMFRVMAFRLNNAGDTFGRFTALYKYDLKKVYDWFTLLDTFDNKANILPYIAAYYFSQTQKKSDVHYMVQYLKEHSDGRLKEKWWWRTQAVYLALHKLKDQQLALELAAPLENAQGIPYWARQMPAFVHEQRGEFGDALEIVENIIKNSKDIPPSEQRFMYYFVKERLNKLEELEKGLGKNFTPPPIEESAPKPSDDSHVEGEYPAK
ncbi:MAG: hypothetical protein U1E36_06105 [Rickettsiales bacterium]